MKSNKRGKTLLILVSKRTREQKAFFRSLQTKLQDKVTIELAQLTDLSFFIDGKNTTVRLDGVDVANYDLVYIRRGISRYSAIIGSLANYLNYKKVNFKNPTLSLTGLSNDKLTPLLQISLSDLPVPKSYYCPTGGLKEDVKGLVSFVGFPMVAKNLKIHRGEGVALIKSEEELKRFLSKQPDSLQFIFQEFHPNDEEYRLLVLGGRVAVFERKIRTNNMEFRSNVHLGASEKFMDPALAPKEMKEIAIKGAKAIGIEIAGADVLVEKETGKYYLIEVNRRPGFTLDGKSPEIDEVAKYFLEELEKNPQK